MKMPLPQRLAALLLAATCSPIAAAEFHPISAVTLSASSALYSVENLIQGSGSGFAASEPHNRLGGTADSTWVTDGSGADYFAGPAVGPTPVISFDLGSNVLLSEISTWGYVNGNGNGARDFSLRFATNAEDTDGFGTSITYNPSFVAGLNQTPRNSNAFSQNVIARYVEMTITDNYFGTGISGGDRVGLGEVAFENTGPVSDPNINLPANIALDLDGSVQLIDIPVGNLGATLPLTGFGISFSGANAAAFSPISTPTSIAPGGTDTITISFNPNGLSGQIAANLLVTSNDTETPTATVSMTGFLHDPQISVAASFDFGQFPSGAGLQSASIPVTNAGASNDLNITSPSLSGPDAASFAVTAFPATLAPLAAGQIDIDFTPTAGDGFYNAVLTIPSNDALTPSVAVNLAALVSDTLPGSGLRINEFMASNSTTLNDGDGNSSDWIEIHNAGPGSADLAGWHLTDSSGNLTKWTFPPATTLADGTFLVVFASGQNTDDYIDADGSLHTNFKLSSGGEYLALVRPDGSTIVTEFSPTYPTQFTDIAYGAFQASAGSSDVIASSDGDVLVPTDDTLGTTWTFENFTPDLSWTTDGTGTGVGYDTGTNYDQYIDIDVNAIMRLQNASIYIRIPFTVADKDAVAAMTLALRYDDGFVAYLNGTEIVSRNAPAAPVWNSTTLNGTNVSEPLSIETIDVTSGTGALLNGANVLAIHGLNSTAGNSDFLIDPTLTLDLSGTGPLAFGYLSLATPGAPNTGASTSIGPEISAVTGPASQPGAADNITVTALVEPRLAAVATVELLYRINYDPEITLTMRDDGITPDTTAGDDIFAATIPASAFGDEDMVRWRVTSSDTASAASTAPAFLDSTGNNQSPEYYGTAIAAPAATSQLPLLQWYAQNIPATHTRSGTRGSVFFNERFYDNIFIRARGQSNRLVSQKFDFNRGDPFNASPELSSIGEININGNSSDSTSIRQTLAFDAHRTAGVASCFSELWEMRVNGGADRVGIAIEQIDEDFLRRVGYDPDGDLYKFVQRANLDPVFFDIITGIEKKTNLIGDNQTAQSELTSLGELVTALNAPTSAARRAYVIDNLDLPQVINYMAVRSIIQDADDLRKNFYAFRDIHGDDRWRIFPWDKDWTFGILGDGGPNLPHPFFGDEERPKINANQWNVLYDVMFEETTTQRLYLQRIRTLMDDLLQPASTPLAERYFENRATEIINPAAPLLSTDISSINSYLDSRRSILANNYPALIPASQPANPAITITAAEYNPASGNQQEEYIRITTTETSEIDISGWTLSDGVAFTFAPGTVIERGGDLYISPDTLAFRNRSISPTGGEFHLCVGPYSGQLSNFGETITLSDATGTVVDTFTTPFDPSDAQLYLVVSEIMYNPADPTPDAEFIEVTNISDTVTLDLTGVRFTAGINYDFPAATSLAPGARIVVNFADFLNDTRLNNGGDSITLDDASDSTIKDFSYNDNPPWPTSPDGDGPSLVLIAPATNPDPDLPQNWRPSTTNGGNPGASDSIPYPGGDLLTYALAAPAELTIGAGGLLEYTSQLNIGADDVTVTTETSTDMITWIANTGTLLDSVHNGAGIITLTNQFPTTSTRFFIRTTVTER